jgi:hypothetical protein
MPDLALNDTEEPGLWGDARLKGARRLADHVLGIPVWPVGVGFPSLRFMIPVSLRGANHRLRKVAH